MSKQTEITERTPLLLPDGNLNAVGWCRHCLADYNKNFIPAFLRPRKKEWDFYQISDGNWLIQINFANISVAAFATCSILNLRSGERHDLLSLKLLPCKKFALSSVNAESPSCFKFKKGNTYLEFNVQKDFRDITFISKKGRTPIEVKLRAKHLPNHESITVITPFRLPKRFFLTTKINCMQTEGFFRTGDFRYDFNPAATFCVLDWGRGVWPHKNFWYWGNGSKIINGKLFGFEITWGIGDDSQATETCLFYDGKAHKIGAVDVSSPPYIQGFMKPWTFISDDGRFNLTMTPFFDNETGALFFGLLGMKSHQVHGYFNGTVTLDDGTVLTIRDMYAFCEYVENLW